MGLREKLARFLGIDPSSLPGSIQFIGDVALVKLPSSLENRRREVGEAILELVPRVKTVCQLKGIRGEFRSPEIEVIAGNGTETLHCENGVYFKIDVAKFMLSKGNHFERKRLTKLVTPGEVVVDMFAGIGYFALQIAKHTKASLVIAIEKNPEAYSYLLQNVAINGSTNVVSVLGDCREVARLEEFQRIADRVIMGYPFRPLSYFGSALRFAKAQATIHLHFLSRKGEADSFLEKVKIIAEKKGYVSSVKLIRRVKSYAPRICHYVADLEVKKKRSKATS